ncbi:MAG: cyclic pyranopterin monophosphate synthase MoaC [Nitrospirae bacterium]|nr:cyclic pyranopterin monophosphate synthase MoaC [Nitrospirota bacterium]MBF0536335.1 cyclic pyranopterin monophosphate synthase MoaC [Nitrospirota bacterium]MBF0618276.1 cyclic pyranopterin monophosphate synthase MoaC [Nitrospirota bacterium]
MSDLTHFDENGAARMVDVTPKGVTDRFAQATATVNMRPETLNLIVNKELAKGDVLAVARLAGIMASKQTPHLIPLCHPLMITSVAVDFKINLTESQVQISADVKTSGQTGVEMEALTAVTIAALTVYDMCKAVDKSMAISDIMLIEKRGGKSGTFKRETESGAKG